MNIQCYDGDGVRRVPWYKQSFAVSFLVDNRVAETHTSTTLEDALESVKKLLQKDEHTEADMVRTDTVHKTIKDAVELFLEAGGGDTDWVLRGHGNTCVKFECHIVLKRGRW